MNTPPPNLEQRLRRIERTNRTLTAGLVCLASLLVISATSAPKPTATTARPPSVAPASNVGTTGQQAPLPEAARTSAAESYQAAQKKALEVTPSVRANNLVLVDRNGRTRATLSADSAGRPALVLFDASGAQELAVRESARGPECVLYGPGGEAENLALRNGGTGRPLIQFSNGGDLVMNLRNGTTLASLGADRDDVNFKLNYLNGQNAAHLAVTNQLYFDGASRDFRKIDFELSGARGTPATDNSISLQVTAPVAGGGYAKVNTFGGHGKHAVTLYAEGTQAIVSARAQSGPGDQVFRSKWRFPLTPDTCWEVPIDAQE